MKKINKKIDFFVIFSIVVIGAIISLIFSLKPLILAIITLLIPSIYLILKERKNFWKTFWAVVIFGTIIGFIFDFVVTFNTGWIVTKVVIPWKIFGILPWDNVIGWMLMTLFIIVFYEHFLDDEKNKKISKNLIWALIPTLMALSYFLAVYFINPNALKISYVYLTGGLIAIIFPIIANLYKPKFLNKFLKLAAFFFVVWFIIELVVLKTNGWVFTGQYIGKVEIFGLMFPFEELIFWMIFYAATVVSYYEFFIDDAK